MSCGVGQRLQLQLTPSLGTYICPGSDPRKGKKTKKKKRINNNVLCHPTACWFERRVRRKREKRRIDLTMIHLFYKRPEGF